VFKIFLILLSLGVASIVNGQGGWLLRSASTKADLVAVYFTSQDRGFVAGDDGYLASTDDGGQTWERYDLKTTASINEIYFRNETNGYLAAGRLLFVTDDGGRSWRETRIYRNSDFRNGTPELISIRFSDKKRGLAIGSIVNRDEEVIDSLVMRTSDGGDTWQRVIIPSKLELFHLDFNGNSHAWIVGDKGLILATRDGGATWVTQNSGASRALFCVDFRDDNEGYAVGGGGTILRTVDGGDTWIRVPNPFTETLKRVIFSDDKTGWIVGLKGIVLRTSDKGKTWVRQDFPAKSDIYGLFMSKKFGWAVGAAGASAEYQK